MKAEAIIAKIQDLEAKQTAAQTNAANATTDKQKTKAENEAAKYGKQIAELKKMLETATTDNENSNASNAPASNDKEEAKKAEAVAATRRQNVRKYVAKRRAEKVTLTGQIKDEARAALDDTNDDAQNARDLFIELQIWSGCEPIDWEKATPRKIANLAKGIVINHPTIISTVSIADENGNETTSQTNVTPVKKTVSIDDKKQTFFYFKEADLFDFIEQITEPQGYEKGTNVPPVLLPYPEDPTNDKSRIITPFYDLKGGRFYKISDELQNQIEKAIIIARLEAAKKAQEKNNEQLKKYETK